MNNASHALRTVLRPFWLRLYKAYAIRGHVTAPSDLRLGVGSMIWAPNSLTIGTNVYVGKHCTIECDGEIGDDVLIANAVGLVGRYDHDFRTVGVSVRNAPWVGDGPGKPTNRLIVGPDVWIGYGAIILTGIEIGRGAIVAAGAVVTKTVRAYAIVAGNPAREVGSRFQGDTIEKHERLLRLRAGS